MCPFFKNNWAVFLLPIVRCFKININLFLFQIAANWSTPYSIGNIPLIFRGWEKVSQRNNLVSKITLLKVGFFLFPLYFDFSCLILIGNSKMERKLPNIITPSLSSLFNSALVNPFWWEVLILNCFPLTNLNDWSNKQGIGYAIIVYYSRNLMFAVSFATYLIEELKIILPWVLKGRRPY